MRISNGIAINVVGIALEAADIYTGAPAGVMAVMLLCSVASLVIAHFQIGLPSELGLLDWWNREWFR